MNIAARAYVGKLSPDDWTDSCLCPALTSIQFSATVKTIGDGAFKGCTTLRDINIPAGVISIGTKAFGSSKMKATHVEWNGRRCSEFNSDTEPNGWEKDSPFPFYCKTQAAE